MIGPKVFAGVNVGGRGGTCHGMGIAGTANHGIPVLVWPMTTPLSTGFRVAGPLKPGGTIGGMSNIGWTCGCWSCGGLGGPGNTLVSS